MIRLAKVANNNVVNKIDELQELLDQTYGVNCYDISIIINDRLIMQKNRKSINVVPTSDGIRSKSKMLVRDNVVQFREKV